jgi:hypothetical protein
LVGKKTLRAAGGKGATFGAALSDWNSFIELLSAVIVGIYLLGACGVLHRRHMTGFVFSETFE